MHAAIEVSPALRCIAAPRLADAASIGAKNKGCTGNTRKFSLVHKKGCPR